MGQPAKRSGECCPGRVIGDYYRETDRGYNQVWCTVECTRCRAWRDIALWAWAGNGFYYCRACGRKVVYLESVRGEVSRR